MSKFTSGKVPYPDYDAADVDNFNRKVEFTDDVFIYGQLYADIDSQDITFADDQSFTSITIEDNLFVTGFSTFFGPVDIDYLTVYQRHNVGASGTVFVAISSTSDLDGQTGGRVGIGSTQPDTRFQVGAGDTSFVVTDSGLVGIGTTQPAQKFQAGIGTQSLVVTGVGTLGVGTASPQTILHLHDSASTRIQFTDDAMGAAASDGVIMGLNGDDDFFMNNRESGKGIKFFTGSDDMRMFINSDGDVLINTVTTPSADIKLLVNGNGGVSSGSYFSFRGDYGNVPEPAAYAIKFVAKWLLERRKQAEKSDEGDADLPEIHAIALS